MKVRRRGLRILELTAGLGIAVGVSACTEQRPSTDAASAALSLVPSASAAAPPGARSVMAVEAFCTALHARFEALAKRCVKKPETANEQEILRLDLQSDACTALIQNVEIVADKVPACLAEVRLWWDAGIGRIEHRPACRRAFIGKTPVGGRCSLDLECPAGSACVADPASTDPSANVCSPVVTVGMVCKEHNGDTCGPDLYCAGGKCARRPVLGEPCTPSSQHCAAPLTCLLDKSADKQGTCGPRRKAGQACHRWAECEGACVAASQRSQDGRCQSFCGSG